MRSLLPIGLSAAFAVGCTSVGLSVEAPSEDVPARHDHSGHEHVRAEHLRAEHLRAEHLRAEHAHEAALVAPRLHSLEVTVEEKRDGTVEVEQTFTLEAEGRTIRRGPVLNFVTVFHGPAELVLDNGMKVESVVRKGEAEPFQEVRGDGQRLLFIGSEDVVLEHGRHEYTVRYRALGGWRKRGGELFDAFDVTGPFQGFVIDRVRARVILPSGVALERHSTSLTGSKAEGPGFTVVGSGNELAVETTAPLVGNHSLFLNTSWSAAGFSGRRHWVQVLLQHPRLPLSAFGGAALLLALWLILAGSRRREKNKTVAATA
ncbi:MAG: DUF2207 domain-containing protein [Verrucomicrobiales bacterium]